MNDAQENGKTNPRSPSWYVKIEDGSTYGPVVLDELRVWAETGRVAPGQLISQDRQEWIFAENLPELGMEWRIEVKNGAMYGPVNIEAVRSLVEDGVVSKKAVLVNERTHRQSTVARELRASDRSPVKKHPRRTSLGDQPSASPAVPDPKKAGPSSEAENEPVAASASDPVSPNQNVSAQKKADAESLADSDPVSLPEAGSESVLPEASEPPSARRSTSAKPEKEPEKDRAIPAPEESAKSALVERVSRFEPVADDSARPARSASKFDSRAPASVDLSPFRPARADIGRKQDPISWDVPSSSDSAGPESLRSENEALRKSLSQAKSEIEKYRTNIKKLQDYLHDSAEEIAGHHERLQKEYRLVSSELVDTRMRLDNETKASHDCQAELKRKSGELEQMSARYERLFKDAQTREQDLLRRIEELRKASNDTADKLDKAEWEFQRKAEAQARENAVLTETRAALESQWEQTKREMAEVRENWERSRRDAERLKQEAQAAAQRETALQREIEAARAVIAEGEKELASCKGALEKETQLRAELKTASQEEQSRLQEQVGQLNGALRDAQEALRASEAKAEAARQAAREQQEQFKAREAQTRAEHEAALAREQDAGKQRCEEAQRNIEDARQSLSQTREELADTRAKGEALAATLADREKRFAADSEERKRALAALASERDRLAKKLEEESQARLASEAENDRLQSTLDEERAKRNGAEADRDILRTTLEKEKERTASLTKRSAEQSDALAARETRIAETDRALVEARARGDETIKRLHALEAQAKETEAQRDATRETLTREREASAAAAERVQNELQETETRLSEALKEIERQNDVADREQAARRQIEEQSQRHIQELQAQTQALSAELDKFRQESEQQKAILDNEVEMLEIKLDDARQRSEHYRQEFEAAATRVKQQKGFYDEEREMRRRAEAELLQAKTNAQEAQFEFRKKEREFTLEKDRIEGDLYRARQKEQALLKRLETLQSWSAGERASIPAKETRRPAASEPVVRSEKPDAEADAETAPDTSSEQS